MFLLWLIPVLSSIHPVLKNFWVEETCFIFRPIRQNLLVSREHLFRIRNLKNLLTSLKKKDRPLNIRKRSRRHPLLQGRDPLFEEAIRTVCQHDRASASLLQRRLSVGYSRAARILDQLQEAGIVGHAEGSKPRDVLIRNADEIINSLNQ